LSAFAHLGKHRPPRPPCAHRIRHAGARPPTSYRPSVNPRRRRIKRRRRRERRERAAWERELPHLYECLYDESFHEPEDNDEYGLFFITFGELSFS